MANVGLPFGDVAARTNVDHAIAADEDIRFDGSDDEYDERAAHDDSFGDGGIDWGEDAAGSSIVNMDDLDGAGLGPRDEFGEDDTLAMEGVPLGVQVWQQRAESTLVAKASRDTLTLLAAAPEAEHVPDLRDKLLGRVADADVFGGRALAALRQRPPLPDIQALLAEGLALGVETRELVRLQQCVRQALEVQNRLAAFDMAEEQMELRTLRGILNDMERLACQLDEEELVRERWSAANAWLERARAVLSVPRRTRQGKQCKVQGAKDSVRQRFSLSEVETLVSEADKLPLICRRHEPPALAQLVDDFKSWREEVAKRLSCGAGGDAGGAGAAGGTAGDDDDDDDDVPLGHKRQRDADNAANQEGVLRGLVERGMAFPIESEEAAGLALMLWTCRAQAASKGKTSFKDLVELSDKATALAAHHEEHKTCDAPPQELVCAIQSKRQLAEDWVKRAKTALKRRWTVEQCKLLLHEASKIEVDSEEAFLIEYQLEAAATWLERVQALLGVPMEDNYTNGDYKVLKALLKESSRIAVHLDLVPALEARMEQVEQKEQEESECEWAMCDKCNKWRRLAKGQQVNEQDKFFCEQVSKTCADDEDQYDPEKEEITRVDHESDYDSDADDDLTLADRKLLVPDALVWAQHDFYPFWPARIRDHEADHITAEILKAKRPGRLLVQFLGKSATAGLTWIERRKMLPFRADQDPNDRAGMRPIRSQEYKSALEAARAIQKRLDKAAKRQLRAEGYSSSQDSDSVSGESDTSDTSISSDDEEYRKLRKLDQDYEEDQGRGKSKSGGSKRRRRKDERREGTGNTVHLSLQRDADGKFLPRDGHSKTVRDERRHDKQQQRREGSGAGGGVSRRGGAKQDERAGSKVVGPLGLGGVKKEAPPGSAGAKREDASAPGTTTGPLFPKWFLQLPSGWQGSYTNYTAVCEAETKLKQRLQSLSSAEDIRREVRNMVFCAFISAISLELPPGAPSLPEGASASQAAQRLEDALFGSCGSSITADYRQRYRVLTMALRSCPKVRIAVLGGKLSPATFVGMSCPALDTFGKSTSTLNKSCRASVPKAGVKEEGEGEGGNGGSAVAVPQRLLKVAPLKAPAPLSVVVSKVAKVSRSPSPSEGAGDKKQAGPLHSPGNGSVIHKLDSSPASDFVTVGDVCWVGEISKAESNTRVRLKAIALEGARLRAVGRVPSHNKVVGRMPPESLAKFLVDLTNSRSRQKTVVRFDLEGDIMRKGGSFEPAAVKAYNRLVEEYECKNRVGVINLKEKNEQLYIVGPTAARTVLRLDAPGHVIYGVFVMKVSSSGKYWADVHPPSPKQTHTLTSVEPAEGSEAKDEESGMGDERPAKVARIKRPEAAGEGAGGQDAYDPGLDAPISGTGPVVPDKVSVADPPSANMAGDTCASDVADSSANAEIAMNALKALLAATGGMGGASNEAGGGAAWTAQGANPAGLPPPDMPQLPHVGPPPPYMPRQGAGGAAECGNTVTHRVNPAVEAHPTGPQGVHASQHILAHAPDLPPQQGLRDVSQPPAYVAPGGGPAAMDPHHSQHMQQLQSLSSEQLIALLMNQPR